MATPLAKAAKRAGSRTEDPSTAAPLRAEKAKGFRYCWISFQVSALDPLRASPRPSKIDFFPSSSVSAGMSASLMFTTNSAVCVVNFGTWGKLVSHDAGAVDAGVVWAPANLDSEAPKSPNETPAPAACLRNARLFIPPLIILLMRCHHSFQFVLEY